MPWWSDLISRLSLRGVMDGWAALWTIGSALIMGHRLDRHMVRHRSTLPWYRRDMGATAGLIVGVILVLIGWIL
ncbi:hypothetical protein F1643_07910 [Azospirillum sp. INR13]|uniref:hypothetical protein n=1 Tax=Azospirillum sp. INR13 TaxID=2596919 RepID=UPI0018927270|nr:hypothetical protein [Azospirillum sp. INR13]MBF5094422.1 hypothetical protein [Azospirillum sp. INR13]